jgi:SAM-dependent methyltransferase
MRVVDVGCATGEEIGPLFYDAAEVVAVDISRQLAERALQANPGLVSRAIETPAADLAGLSDRSLDLYFSSRAYQSRDFEISGAVSEALRVVVPGGTVLITIADGFVTWPSRDRPELQRGLLSFDHGADVDPGLAVEMVRKVRREFQKNRLRTSVKTLAHGERLILTTI